MRTNRFLKLVAIVLSVFMLMTAIAIPTFAADDGGDAAPAGPTPVTTDASYDKWDGVDYAEEFWADYVSLSKNETPALADPIIIDSAAKLAGLAKMTNDAKNSSSTLGAFGGQVFKITKNIDLQCYEFESIGETWSRHFGGIIEGDVNGAPAVIANLYLKKTPRTTSNNGNSAFIGNLCGGGVANLTFVNAYADSSNNYGGTGIVIGYLSSSVVKVENITVIDSSMKSGRASSASSNSGIIAGTVLSTTDLTFKNCAVINTFIDVTDGTGNVATMVGDLRQGGKDTDAVSYTFENCYVSGSTVTEVDSYFGGFVGNVQRNNTTQEVEITFKNCHYNANLFGGTFRPAAILIANASSGVTLNVDGFLCTGTVSGLEDASALIGTGGDQINVNVTNAYTTTALTLFANAKKIDDAIADGADITKPAEPTITTVTATAITGAGAATALAGLDFTNVWNVRDGKIATLKIAGDDDFRAVTTFEPSDDPVDPPVDPVDPPVDPVDPPVDPVDPPAGGDTTTTTTTPAPAADDNKDDGCGSVVSATALVTLLTVGMGVTVIRKKRD